MDAPQVQDPAAREQSSDPGLLIVFLRKAELGKVKTRLAKDIGDKAALDIYTELLHLTQQACLNTPFNLYYADEIGEAWNGSKTYQQQGTELGERMEAAFIDSFKTGKQKVVIIGSDCPEITEDLITQAFTALNENDIVIGPATDGGYYLLGMSRMIHEVFRNKSWSSPKLLAETKQTIEQLNLNAVYLSELQDLDTLDDLRNLQSRGILNSQNFLIK